MRVSMDVFADELYSAVLWFRQLCGEDIARRIQQFEIEAQENSLLGQYNRETFKLEYAIGQIFSISEQGGSFPLTPELSEAYNFIVGFNRVYQNLTDVGKQRILQNLRTSFTHPYGLRPFAFEFMTAIHFLQKGWDVTFVDIEDQGRFDLLVEHQGERFEIECKSISNDAGRLIARRDVCRMGGRLKSIIHAVENKSSRVLTVRITRRLDELTEVDLQALTQAAQSALDSGIGATSTAFLLSVEMKPGLIIPPERRTEEATSQFVREQIGAIGRHILINANRRTGEVMAIVLESEASDDVLGKIFQRAKTAANQCSHQLPSLIAIQIADMSKSSLEGLLNTAGSGVHRIAHGLFEGPPRRPHVNGIAFSALPVSEEFTTPGPNISNVSANVLLLKNPNPRFVCAAISQGLFF